MRALSAKPFKGSPGITADSHAQHAVSANAAASRRCAGWRATSFRRQIASARNSTAAKAWLQKLISASTAPAPFAQRLDETPPRPLFLFDPPQPVEVIAQVPDGPPHRFRWKRKLHEVRLYEGPERIAAEWWRRKGGENGPGEGKGKAGLTRDYYRVEDMRGRRYWLFRHGLYEEKTAPRWYVHGLFA